MKRSVSSNRSNYLDVPWHGGRSFDVPGSRRTQSGGQFTDWGRGRCRRVATSSWCTQACSTSSTSEVVVRWVLRSTAAATTTCRQLTIACVINDLYLRLALIYTFIETCKLRFSLLFWNRFYCVIRLSRGKLSASTQECIWKIWDAIFIQLHNYMESINIY